MNRILSAALFAALLTGPAFLNAALPNPEPYFASGKTERVTPRLIVQDFTVSGKTLSIPSFVAGNKSVTLYQDGNRKNPSKACYITILVNGKEALRLFWWGDNKNGYGYPFRDLPGKPPVVSVDPGKGTVTVRKPYLDAQSVEQQFIYTLKALPQSRIELTWNAGAIWMAPLHFLGKELAWKNWNITPENSMLPKHKEQKQQFVKGSFIYNGTNPLEGFRLELPETEQGSFVLSRVIDNRWKINRLDGIVRYGGKLRKLVIDLGECVLGKAGTPPPMGGIDFWKEDRLHVPGPATRNILPNPSFEQGLRFWSWNDGGGAYTPGKCRYEVVPEGRFGKHALAIHPTQPRVPSMRSFPLALNPGKTYTLSFYAKAEKPCTLSLALASVTRAGKFIGKYGPVSGDAGKPGTSFQITPEWKRYQRTFTADSAGVRLLLNGAYNSSRILVDGMQLEEGKRPTDFITAPIEGNFITASPDNDLVKGKPFGSAFLFQGAPGTAGEVKVTVTNAYQEVLMKKTLSVKIGADGTRKVDFPMDPNVIQEGIFVVRADYSVNGGTYTNYYRFNVMTPLHNTHPTKDIFGTLHAMERYSRGEDIGRKYRDWGFGSTSWGYNPQGGIASVLEKKYGIRNYLHVLAEKEKKYGPLIRSIHSVSPELVKEVEESAFREVSKYDPEQAFSWALYNEEEGSPLPTSGKYDDYFKLQQAFARGARRANPKVKIAPTHGTSGYSNLRGYDAYEGYLSAAKKQNFRYDAITIHPYGAVDGNSLGSQDLDSALAMLTAQMKRYGYGKETPIYVSEMFMYPFVRIPQWGALLNGDDWRNNGTVTYSLGNREFIQASSAARVWIIALKYWPQVRMTNLWISAPFLDMHLSPILMCKAANTLGHLLPDVEFHSEIKPSVTIRGYVFKRKNAKPIAAIWCIDPDVENGLKRGPEITVNFDQKVEFVDLMGAKRMAAPDQNGVFRIPLTPAPLFVIAEDVEKLSSALKKITSDDVAATLAFSVKPALDGSLCAELRNRTAFSRKGNFKANGKEFAYHLKPEGMQTFQLTPARKIEPDTLYRSDFSLVVIPEKGDPLTKRWDMDYFYIPHVNGSPDWSQIPGIPMTNFHPAQSGIQTGDLEAVYKLAWNRSALFVRVEVKDDKFMDTSEQWKRPGADRMLWVHDGCLELYFDCGSNGRSNSKPGYDDDDYRYDFAQKNGKGVVYRFKEVFHQLADGINMPSKDEAAKNVKCEFTRTKNGYAYTISFAERYLLPIVLKKGFPFGFALYLHDKDPGKKDKALTSGMKSGAHCQADPANWPIAILAE